MPAGRRGRGRGSRGPRYSGRESMSKYARQIKMPALRVVHFAKDEIVWAKMRFFPPWPAKVSRMRAHKMGLNLLE